MKEQPLFAPGDRVVCVNGKTPVKGITTAGSLIEGKVYVVTSSDTCKCGKVFVKVGIPAISIVERCVCGHSTHTNGVMSHHQTRFVPVDFDRYAEETFHQSLKGKPVNV